MKTFYHAAHPIDVLLTLPDAELVRVAGTANYPTAEKLRYFLGSLSFPTPKGGGFPVKP